MTPIFFRPPLSIVINLMLCVQILNGLCHQFRIILNLFNPKALGIDIWRLILKFCLTFSLIFNGPLKFLCLGSKIIQNYHFHFKCAMSCSKRILVCSMREQLYFHHKGQLCSSMRLHKKIMQLPPF
jgi:hypothetical protein